MPVLRRKSIGWDRRVRICYWVVTHSVKRIKMFKTRNDDKRFTIILRTLNRCLYAVKLFSTVRRKILWFVQHRTRQMCKGFKFSMARLRAKRTRVSVTQYPSLLFRFSSSLVSTWSNAIVRCPSHDFEEGPWYYLTYLIFFFFTNKIKKRRILRSSERKYRLCFDPRVYYLTNRQNPVHCSCLYIFRLSTCNKTDDWRWILFINNSFAFTNNIPLIFSSKLFIYSTRIIYHHDDWK